MASSVAPHLHLGLGCLWKKCSLAFRSPWAISSDHFLRGLSSHSSLLLSGFEDYYQSPLQWGDFRSQGKRLHEFSRRVGRSESKKTWVEFKKLGTHSTSNSFPLPSPPLSYSILFSSPHLPTSSKSHLSFPHFSFLSTFFSWSFSLTSEECLAFILFQKDKQSFNYKRYFTIQFSDLTKDSFISLYL